MNRQRIFNRQPEDELIVQILIVRNRFVKCPEYDDFSPEGAERLRSIAQKYIARNKIYPGLAITTLLRELILNSPFKQEYDDAAFAIALIKCRQNGIITCPTAAQRREIGSRIRERKENAVKLAAYLRSLCTFEGSQPPHREPRIQGA